MVQNTALWVPVSMAGVMLPDQAGADSHGHLQHGGKVKNATASSKDADGQLLKHGELFLSLGKSQGGWWLELSVAGLCILISGVLTCILFVV